MKCEYCSKKLKGKKKKIMTRYCNHKCYLKHYYREKLKNFCKCGNKKYISSKQCQKCHNSNKLKGQLSKLKL